MFELTKIVIKILVGHQHGRKTQETTFWHFFSGLNEERLHF